MKQERKKKKEKPILEEKFPPIFRLLHLWHTSVQDFIRYGKRYSREHRLMTFQLYIQMDSQIV
jgi:hypothetical protein